jgi:hypothetical protein
MHHIAACLPERPRSGLSSLFSFRIDCASFEDPRAISIANESFISETVLSEDGKAHIGILRFVDDPSKPVEGAVISNCAAETGAKQKNWQPIRFQDTLLYVTRLFPLTVVAPSLKTGGCKSLAERGRIRRTRKKIGAPMGRGLINKCNGGSNYLQLR